MRPRLMAVLFLVVLVPMLIQFSLDYRQTEKYMQERARIALEHIADVQQRRMNQEIRRMQQRFELVASRTQMRLSLSRYLQNGDSADLALLTRILTDALASSENFKALWIRDLDGSLVQGITENSIVAADEVPSFLSTEETTLSLAWLSDETSHVWLVGPLVLEQKIIGVLYILSNLDHLFDVMQDFSCRDAGGRTHLVLPKDGQAFDIIESRCTEHGNTLSFTLQEMAEAGFDLASLVLSHADRAVRFDNHLLALRPLDESLGFVWVDTSYDFVRARLLTQITSTLVLVLVFAGLVLLLAVQLAKGLTRPLDHLVEATRQLRRGDLDTRIKGHYWGEFIELRRAFNQMAAKMSRQTKNLRQEIHIRSQSQKELTDLANTDSLTRLINRRHFMDILTDIVSAMDRSTYAGALLYVDLDNFKPINDDFGHEAGDAVLQIVAERLQHLLREGDIAARMGGDEFALLLPAGGNKGFDPQRMAERVEHKISQPISFKGQEFFIECSIGITEVNTNDSPQDIINRADAAMYRVKAQRKMQARS